MSAVTDNKQNIMSAVTDTNRAKVLRWLIDGADELLDALLMTCTTRTVCMLSLVCRRWAAAAEMRFRAACQQHKWALPRRPRLQGVNGTLGAELPWRACFINRACRTCLTAAGDFAVRRTDAGAPRFYLCRVCAKQARVVERLQLERATLDVTGLSGKPLYSRNESRFCSEVSRLSKESMDNASGARAEVLRRAGPSRRR